MGSKQSYLWVQTAAWNGKQVCILGKEMSSGLTSRSPERVSDKEEGESHLHMGTKDGKGAGKNSGESGMRNLEVWLQGVQREFLTKRKGKAIYTWGPKTEKVQEINSGESGRRNLEVWLQGVQREFLTKRKGKAIYTWGPKMEKVQEKTAESLVGGIWRLRVSEGELRV